MASHRIGEAMIWTNGGLVYWRIYASLGLSEVMEYHFEHTKMQSWAYLKIKILYNTLMWYIGEWEMKRFQTRRSLVWNRFIPHSSQASIYHIKV